MTQHDPVVQELLSRLASSHDIDVDGHLRSVRQAKHPGGGRRGVTVVALLIAAAGLVLAVRAFRHNSSVPDPATESRETLSQAGTPTPFFPSARQTGDRTRLAIAFLDGTTAEMVYPSNVALERMPVQPAGNVTVEAADRDGFGGGFLIEHRPLEAAEGLGTPVSWHGEPITRWEPVVVEGLDGIALRLGPWVMRIDPAGDMSATPEWAEELLLRNLDGLQTGSGLLILRAEPPVRVWGEGDFPAEPSLFFGDDLIIDVGCSVRGGEEYLQDGVTVHRFRDGVAPGKDYIAWCDPDEYFTIGVYDEQLAEDLIGALAFESVQAP